MTRADTARRRESSSPAVLLLTMYLVLLWGIPSELTIEALGSIGRPSILWGVGCLAWWVWAQVARNVPIERARQPLRTAVLVFVATALVSYALAQAHGLPYDEVSPADSGIVRILSWTGVILTANDLVSGKASAVILLRRMAIGGGLVAVIGLLQFVTRQPIIDVIDLPGLTASTDAPVLQTRGGFARAGATASHPLEYAVVLSATLPIALAFGFADIREQWRRWWSSTAILIASVLSVSRSAIVGAAVSLMVMVPAVPRRARGPLLLAGAAIAMVLYVAVPGIAGTIKGLFVGAAEDPSTTSRTNSYDLVFTIAQNQLIWGRGLGTFLPRYRILDNQLLLLVIEVGIVGLAVFLVMVVTALVCALRARRAAATSFEAMVSQALAAGVAATVTLFGFFDALSFPMAAGTMAILVGMTGAWANVLGVAESEAKQNARGLADGSRGEDSAVRT